MNELSVDFMSTTYECLTMVTNLVTRAAPRIQTVMEQKYQLSVLKVFYYDDRSVVSHVPQDKECNTSWLHLDVLYCVLDMIIKRFSSVLPAHSEWGETMLALCATFMILLLVSDNILYIT